nr:hypothetical protein [Tanacetum cinerariifolium]
MEEMLYKFIDEGKREHEEMRAFINEFRTTNELLFKERNNSLSKLRLELHEFFSVIDNALISNYEVKGVTTRDLRASLSLMPYMMYEKLGLGEPRPTRMSLELADRIDDLDDTITMETQELLANDKSDSFLLKGVEKSIDQSDLECYESLGNKYDDDFDLEKPIRHIDSFNTPYLLAH